MENSCNEKDNFALYHKKKGLVLPRPYLLETPERSNQLIAITIRSAFSLSGWRISISTFWFSSSNVTL